MFRRALACLLLSSSALAQGAGDAGVLRYCPGSAAPVAYNASTGGYDEGGSFDPLRCAEEPCLEVLHNIFEPLVSVGPNQEILPVLATRWEKRGPRTYRFWLRQGVRFHDGEPFNANSVAFSLTRSSDAYGATAWFPRLRSVQVVDAQTVDVTLETNDSIFLHRLAHMALIQPPRYFRRVGEAEFGSRPVGTGPFKFKNWDGAQRELHLTANEGYWQKGLPKLAGVSFVYRSDDEAYRALLDGEIDLVRRLNPRRTTDFMRSRKGTVRKAWLSQFVIGTFNLMKDGTPLRKKGVREAINLAIHREHLIRYGAMGNGRLIRRYTSPEDANAAKELHTPEWNPTRARQLLAEAGVAPGTPLVVWLDNQVPPGIEAIVQQNLKEVGFAPSFVRASEAEILNDIYVPKFMGKKFTPRFDVLLASIPVGTFEHSAAIPMTMLYAGKPNESAVEDAELDQRFENALGADGPRSPLWAELERYIAAQELTLVGYQEQAVFGAHRPLSFEPSSLLSFGNAEFTGP